VISPKLVEVGRHLNIELLTQTELLELNGNPGNFSARVRQKPRFIDLSKCTSCGECAKVCPISVPDEYNKCLTTRKAAFKQYAQAIPGTFAITKRGTAPCKAICPAHVSVQGFVALINAGKYKEALELFKQDHPFPGVCGRVCHHPCESICTRNLVDDPISIQYLHRFLADEDLKSGARYVPKVKESRNEKVAFVGSGPAGLTAAYYLAIEGSAVTVLKNCRYWAVCSPSVSPLIVFPAISSNPKSRRSKTSAFISRPVWKSARTSPSRNCGKMGSKLFSWGSAPTSANGWASRAKP
jgi:NAD-dependent dihydropyrimidine dehydrogenase PreA subunit